MRSADTSSLFLAQFRMCGAISRPVRCVPSRYQAKAASPNSRTFRRSLESGLVGFDTAIKYYLLAPAGTPSAVLDKLNATLRAALRDQEVRRRFAIEGYEASLGTPEEFAADFQAEEQKWLPLIKALGLKAQ